jgi:hypothetical protein
MLLKEAQAQINQNYFVSRRHIRLLGCAPVKTTWRPKFSILAGNETYQRNSSLPTQLGVMRRDINDH